MEEDQCWMWTKRKYSLTSSNILASTLKPSYDESWEEQAFSEEQAFIWPPRSYPCSFCSREFRSAQALGGHMNVHRRDRARLKQPPSEDDDDHHHIHQSPLTSPNTNSNSDRLNLLASNPKFPPCYDSKSWSQKFDTKKEVEAAEIVSCKRRRITDASSIPFFSKSISEIDNRHHHHHHHHDHIKLKMVEFISPSSINEELDLELRLGHSISKV